MSENVENLVLEYMRRLDKRMDGIESDIRDIKFRTTQQDEKFTNLIEHMNIITKGQNHQNERLDRIDDRLSRIEKLVDVVNA